MRAWIVVLAFYVFKANSFTTNFSPSTFSTTTRLYGSRRRSTRKIVDELDSSSSTPNAGKGVEVTGITLPTENKPLKGWAIPVPGSDADTMTVVFANNNYYGLR